MVLPTYPTAFSDDAKPAQQLAEHEEPPSESSLLPGNKPKDSLNANCGAIRVPFVWGVVRSILRYTVRVDMLRVLRRRRRGPYTRSCRSFG
jgi:hypothetical protein